MCVCMRAFALGCVYVCACVCACVTLHDYPTCIINQLRNIKSSIQHNDCQYEDAVFSKTYELITTAPILTQVISDDEDDVRGFGHHGHGCQNQQRTAQHSRSQQPLTAPHPAL